MRYLISGLLCAGALTACAVRPGHAQDIIGFDRSSFGSVVLSRNQSAGSGIEFELAVGSYNNESIRNYSQLSIFAKMGLSVGRLDILTDAGVFPCTAFIVDNKHILTNYHCVPGILNNAQANATRIEGVKFVAGYTQQGVTEGTRTYTVSSTPVEAFEDLDYSVLEVFGDPSKDYGTLKLATNIAADGDPYWVIGHPMGEAQRISREKCRANAPALADNRLLHTCDTLPGNSGSPVIDASLQRVVGLHHAGSKKDSVNFAIPMNLIVARSKFLKAALDDTAQPTPKPPVIDPVIDPVTNPVTDPVTVPKPDLMAVCNSLYAEAKNLDACFAYRAYVDQCKTHPFRAFGQGYLDNKCKIAVVLPDPPTPTPPKPDPKPKPPVVASYVPEMVRLESWVDVGKSPITVGQFRAFVRATGHRTANSCRAHFNNWNEASGVVWDRPGYSASDSHPVTCVSFADAIAYTNWLSRDTGQRYEVMPSNIWTKIALQANAYSDAVCSNCSQRASVPQRVGSAGGALLGIQDALGNVWQWMGDCSGSKCDMRGGAWDTASGDLISRKFNRDRFSFRTNALGFRVVRYP